jgi:hypothetical protein
MDVLAKDINGLTFHSHQQASSVSSAAVLVEEYLKTLANFDKLDSITVCRNGFNPPEFWNKYPATKPSQYGNYLVCRKGSKKYEFETWNNTSWAYSNNEITHWAIITPPNEEEKDGK